MTTTLDMLAQGIRSFRNSVPTPFVGRSAPMTGLYRRDDKRGQQAATGGNSTLYSVVNRTSTSTAAVNWRLWKKTRSGLDEDRIEITSHQALRVWKKPNNFFTGREFVEAGQQHNDLTGETWWVIERGEIPGYGQVSFPTAMWVVRPDRMVPIPSRTDYLAGYMYVGPDGEEIALTLDQVIQTKIPSPLDPYRGMGPVQSLMTTLDAQYYSAEWNAAFFANSAMPGGVLSVPGNVMMNRPAWEQLRERWVEQHKGVGNAHRVAILEAGMTFTPIASSMKDMQFAELEKIGQDKILRAFGMAGFAIGDLEDANRASSEAAADWFAANLTVPRLDRIKDALNFRFLPMFGDPRALEFDYDSPVEPDQEQEDKTLTAKTAAYKVLIDAGVEPADAAKVTGLPEMKHAPKPAPAPAQPPGVPAEDDQQPDDTEEEAPA